MKRDPFNITFLDIDKVIKEEGLKEVTSEFIRESSSNKFHPEGLFSEQIFGEIASQKRLETCGYIKLNCRVFHPIVYQNLQALKRFYVEIMAGTSYAVWDSTECDFVRASETEVGADTGFVFFLKYFDKINFNRNKSIQRDDKIDVIQKFKNLRLIDKLIVIPAGVRDMKEDQGRMEKDSINSLYSSLMRNAKSMTKGADTNPLFDSVHYTIQKRVVEIYTHVADIVRGKRGFFEDKYSHRSIARGTRNVITASDMDASDPESPQYHKVDECKVPLFQAAKAAANYLVYWYKTLFFDQVVNMGAENVPMINPKTLHLEYVPLESKDKDTMTTAEGIEKIIDRFRDPFNRFKPFTVHSNNQEYYLYMVYDRGDHVHLIRNVDEFKQQMLNENLTFDEKKLRPITHVEMLYIASFVGYQGVHATCTRYPIVDEQSIFISNTHLMTTSPSRIVRLHREVKDLPEDILLPEYPIFGKKFVDALMLHPTRLKSLNADFDGNCLVGETEIEIRYTDAWFKSTCERLKDKKYYNPGAKGYSDQKTTEIMNIIDHSIYAVQEGWNYAEVRMDQMPQLGKFVRDKNGARVFELLHGIQVLSYYDHAPTYLPIEKLTVEDDCKVAQVGMTGRKAIVSTNPSVAVFHRMTGGLVKVAPSKIGKSYIPFIVKSVQFKNIAPTMTAEDGYKAAMNTIDLSTICPKYLRGFSHAYQMGYLSGIIEKFGKVEKSSTLLGIDISIIANNEDEVRLVEKMLYTIGFRYLPASELGNRFGVRINCQDIDRQRGGFCFKNRSNINTLRFWRPTRVMREQDVIPLTTAEFKNVGNRIAVKGDTNDLMTVSKCQSHALERNLLKKYVRPDEGSPLSKRVYNDNVHWSTGYCKLLREKRQVFDLIVPDSKVFAVNNGMIVYDTCSWIPIFSEEANKECENYLHTMGNYVLPSGEPLADMCDDLVKISFFAMSRDVPELKK